MTYSSDPAVSSASVDDADVARVDAAARELLRRRQGNTSAKRLAADVRPRSIDEALLVQDRVTSSIDDTVGGWKCALPLSDERIIVAPIYSRTIQRDAYCGCTGTGNSVAIEPEIAFVLGQDLPPRREPYKKAQVREAIGSAHLAIEFLGGRVARSVKPGYLEILADCVGNQGVFLGPEIDVPAALAVESLPLTFTWQGQNKEVSGRHPDGAPFAPLLWLVNLLSSRDRALEAGQVVITGSVGGIVNAPIETPLSIRFGALGSCDLRIGRTRF